jgi:hypothetical protein
MTPNDYLKLFYRMALRLRRRQRIWLIWTEEGWELL